MKDKILWILLGSVVVFSLLMFMFTYIFFKEYKNIFFTVIGFSIAAVALPIAILKYYQVSRIRKLEDNFPQFMGDIVEAVRSGMTLPQAINSVSKNDYGELTPYVKKLNAQLEWDIPFSKAFLSFTKSTKSKLIARIGSTIIESHEHGGNLTDVFESISKTTLEIERLREERKLYLNSQIVSGYIIFFVFLAVIIGLQKFLVPSLTQMSMKQLMAESKEENIEVLKAEYKAMFRNLILIQGLFAGLSIGKLSEGQIVGGIKHSLFMMIVGVVIFLLLT
ncbi:MAG: type II secretion system F family protein [Candidatus Aenigmatarchaeota archaeon]|nr:type II secretion system F family protein [Candidatus Aenigmarchaeota archaeon]